MYFPFLRGKQYELLSLREFSKEIKSSKVISPIIEPVKREKKGIETALLQLVTNKVNFTLVANSTIGEIEDPDFILRFIADHDVIGKYGNFQIGIHSFTEPQMRKMLALLKEYGLERTPLALIHNDVIVNEDFVKSTLN